MFNMIENLEKLQVQQQEEITHKEESHKLIERKAGACIHFHEYPGNGYPIWKIHATQAQNEQKS